LHGFTGNKQECLVFFAWADDAGWLDLFERRAPPAEFRCWILGPKNSGGNCDRCCPGGENDLRRLKRDSSHRDQDRFDASLGSQAMHTFGPDGWLDGVFRGGGKDWPY